MTENNDHRFMRYALAEAEKCDIDINDASDNKFSVGCVIVIRDKVVSRGFTGEMPSNTHAEEGALKKAEKAGISLKCATLYATMEPCSVRLFTGTRSCTELIIKAGIQRVVYCAGEPPVYVKCEGHKKLERAGIEVLHLKELEKEGMESCMRFYSRKNI